MGIICLRRKREMKREMKKRKEKRVNSRTTKNKYRSVIAISLAFLFESTVKVKL